MSRPKKADPLLQIEADLVTLAEQLAQAREHLAEAEEAGAALREAQLRWAALELAELLRGG